MPSFPLDSRRLPAAAAIVIAVPAAPVLQLTVGSGRVSLAALVLLPVTVMLAGPRLWPGWGRFGSLILVGPTLLTMVFPGLVILFLAFFELCSNDQTRTYLAPLGAAVALCSFAVPFLLGSAWAVARPSRALWAWPLVLLASLALALVVLALVEGGPHHCET